MTWGPFEYKYVFLPGYVISTWSRLNIIRNPYTWVRGLYTETGPRLLGSFSQGNWYCFHTNYVIIYVWGYLCNYKWSPSVPYENKGIKFVIKNVIHKMSAILSLPQSVNSAIHNWPFPSKSIQYIILFPYFTFLNLPLLTKGKVYQMPFLIY